MEEKVLIVSRKKSLWQSYISTFIYCLCAALCFGGIIAGINGVPINADFFRDVIILAVFLFIFPAIIIALLHMSEIVITNKRVYGKAAFRNRLDLPLDSISAVATGAFKSISISTSSGRITIWGVQNATEFHHVVSKLLIERQEQAKNAKQEMQHSNADEIEKYKKLFDKGIITQEEFDAKKKQLLGL